MSCRVLFPRFKTYGLRRVQVTETNSSARLVSVNGRRVHGRGTDYKRGRPKRKAETLLEAGGDAALSCLSSSLLMAELLRERILHGFHAHCTRGPGFPLHPALVHHTRLHRHTVAPRHREVQQELSAEVVVMRLHPLLDLIGLGLERNLKGKI